MLGEIFHKKLIPISQYSLLRTCITNMNIAYQSSKTTTHVLNREKKNQVLRIPRKRNMLSSKWNHWATFTTSFFQMSELTFEVINSTAPHEIYVPRSAIATLNGRDVLKE